MQLRISGVSVATHLEFEQSKNMVPYVIIYCGQPLMLWAPLKILKAKVVLHIMSMVVFKAKVIHA